MQLKAEYEQRSQEALALKQEFGQLLEDVKEREKELDEQEGASRQEADALKEECDSLARKRDEILGTLKDAQKKMEVPAHTQP